MYSVIIGCRIRSVCKCHHHPLPIKPYAIMQMHGTNLHSERLMLEGFPPQKNGSKTYCKGERNTKRTWSEIHAVVMQLQELVSDRYKNLKSSKRKIFKNVHSRFE